MYPVYAPGCENILCSRLPCNTGFSLSLLLCRSIISQFTHSWMAGVAYHHYTGTAAKSIPKLNPQNFIIPALHLGNYILSFPRRYAMCLGALTDDDDAHTQPTRQLFLWLLPVPARHLPPITGTMYSLNYNFITFKLQLNFKAPVHRQRSHTLP